MMRLKSLQQRFTLFLLVPVALLLTGMGVVGFIYARDKLLEQWRVVTVLRLQRTAHQVDMRLSRVKEWLQMYHATAGEPDAGDIQDWIVEQLERQEGVVRVNLSWNEPQPGASFPLGHRLHEGRDTPGQGRHGKGKIRFYKARVVAVTPPQYDSLVAHETVSLISNLNDEAGATVGKLEVVIRFDYLAENVLASDWWTALPGISGGRFGEGAHLHRPWRTASTRRNQRSCGTRYPEGDECPAVRHAARPRPPVPIRWSPSANCSKPPGALW